MSGFVLFGKVGHADGGAEHTCLDILQTECAGSPCKKRVLVTTHPSEQPVIPEY
jgi:hypothetical protein